MEKWKDVCGYEGLYKISNYRRVYSCYKHRILSSSDKTGWYLSVGLSKNGKLKTHRIHRLVAEHFLENPNNLNVVNHKDMNKQNNNYKNLEWVTTRENILHAIHNKPSILRGLKKIHKGKMIVQKNLKGDVIAVYQNARYASEATGVCLRNIQQVASKEEYKPGKIRHQAGGYKWEFCNEHN